MAVVVQTLSIMQRLMQVGSCPVSIVPIVRCRHGAISGVHIKVSLEKSPVQEASSAARCDQRIPDNRRSRTHMALSALRRRLR